MKYDVWECVDERTKYEVNLEHTDELLKSVIANGFDRKPLFVVPNQELKTSEFMNFANTHFIAGLFDIGMVMDNLYFTFTLVLYSLSPVDSIKIGRYFGSPYAVKSKHLSEFCGKPIKAKSYFESYLRYITAIEIWINYGTIPKDDDKYRFNDVEANSLKKGEYNARYYSKEAFEARAFIRNEETLPLSELVTIIMPEDVSNNNKSPNGKTLVYKDYPFSYEAQDESSGSTPQLKKGDVVIPITEFGRYYLLDVEPSGLLFLSRCDAILRCKKIPPEYLYLYLSSELAQNLYSTLEGFTLKHLTKQEIGAIPIIMPKQDKLLYKIDFEKMEHSIRQYGDNTQNERLEKYHEKLINEAWNVKEITSVEDILNLEILRKLRIKNEEYLRPFLNEDMKELNVCFAGKAYKATLILAGSIMEAILIDWLSDIEGVDFLLMIISL